MVEKLYDLAVKVGSYTDRDGKEKGRWKNVGSVLQLEDGGKMILLDRSFSPAGVPFREGTDQIVVSMFPPRQEDDRTAPRAQTKTPSRTPQTGTAPRAQDNDDIPF